MTEAEATPAPEDAEDGFEWAVVEIFGHRRHAGRAREEERFGAKMLRIDIPTLEWPADNDAREPVLKGWVSHFYGGSSIFSYTLTDEDTAMRINRPYRSAGRYSLPPPDDEDDRFDEENDRMDEEEIQQ